MSQQRESRRNARISLKVLIYTTQRRENLIEMIKIEQMTVSKAARKTGIKRSTARMIIKKYRETGKVFNKRMNSKDIKENTQKKALKLSSQTQNEISKECQNIEEPTINFAPTFDQQFIPQPYFMPPFYYAWPYYPSF